MDEGKRTPGKPTGVSSTYGPARRYAGVSIPLCCGQPMRISPIRDAVECIGCGKEIDAITLRGLLAIQREESAR